MTIDFEAHRGHLRGVAYRMLGSLSEADDATAFAQFADMFARALIDGSVGLVMAPKGRPVRALRFTFENDRIVRAEIIADRAALDALDIAALD